MKDPAYNLIEIATLIEWAISDVSVVTLDLVSEIAAEDRDLYTKEERMLIGDMVSDAMIKLKAKLS